MSRPRKYPPELLDRGARVVIESGRPIAHVARDLGVLPETLRRYVRQVEADEGMRPEQPTSEERGGDQAAAPRELRAAARERDPQGGVGIFRDRARRRPSEVSAFIDEHRERFGVEPICRAMDVSAPRTTSEVLVATARSATVVVVALLARSGDASRLRSETCNAVGAVITDSADDTTAARRAG
jgi:transposase-like protein